MSERYRGFAVIHFVSEVICVGVYLFVQYLYGRIVVSFELNKTRPTMEKERKMYFILRKIIKIMQIRL